MAVPAGGAGTPIKNAIAGRCPRCGQGKLFDGFLKIAGNCAHCGLDNSGNDAADGPAVFVIFIVGFLVAGLAAWLEIAASPPVWLHLALWIPAIIAGSLILLRPFKGFFIGAQFRFRPEINGEEEKQPKT